MERAKWYLKQLFPLLYIATFREGSKRQLCIWRMWMGRCFNTHYFTLESAA